MAQDVERSIYIDTTVLLKQPPEALWNHLVPREATIFGAMHHSLRKKLIEEFDAVKATDRDYLRVVDEQLKAYRDAHADVIKQKPLWGGVLARRHNDDRCIDLMERWYAQVLRYSRRDQLSLPLILSFAAPGEVNIAAEDL
ncbi:MAG: glycosyltransferase domain-containing protein [Pseudomonadota bacterium]